MNRDVILLVEDNPDDEALTLRAVRKNKIANQVIIARDGVEALDYAFGTGAYSDRDMSSMPQMVLLDLKLPRLDGLQVLKRLKADKADAVNSGRDTDVLQGGKRPDSRIPAGSEQLRAQAGGLQRV